MLSLLPSEGGETIDIKEGHDHGYDDLEDGFHPLLYFHALAGIGLGNEVVPAPAELIAAEQRKDERADRQQVGRNDEIPEIEPCASLCEGLEGKGAVAQSGSKSEQEDDDTADDAALGSGPAGLFAGHGEDVLKNSKLR